jgi:hypothetical protein
VECDQWAEDHLQCKGEYHPDFHTVSDERFAALVAAAEREACKQWFIDDSERFAAQVALAEREACAKVCDEMPLRKFPARPSDCAAAIRARGQA